ncbi:g1019 [Coccomyxa viridis]|uniref:G1019 protein n=1 Tax=Coccomyxa viridis TaxID=1274662 RepID=A0ABP1FH71_9CHLO
MPTRGSLQPQLAPQRPAQGILTDANSSAPAAGLGQKHEGQEGSQGDALSAWLQQHDLAEYCEAFSRAGVGPDMLALLGDEELRQMGVLTLGPRRRILAAIHATQASVQSSGVAEGGGKITSFFVRKGAGTAACPGPAKPAQQSRAHEWQHVKGTSFLVDCFGKSTQLLKCKSWFLTHFHSDHYKGLRASFKQGHIYCTHITARLAHNKLKVPWERFKTVQLRAPLLVEGVTVTFLDANHCPGAVMILFEVPGHAPVLHTGDFRYHVGMQQEQALQRVRGIASIVLDTTYCSPQYLFPPQLQVLHFVLEAVRAEAFNPATLFLFGSYTIGKERLFLEVARILKRKVYVSVAKRKIMEALNLPAEYKALLTTDDRAALLHAVPLWRVSLKHMARLLKHYRGRYNTIVGFQPTGWSMQTDRGHAAARGRRRQKGTLIVYQVPYSEHSSFSELQQFVGFMQPQSLVPSVGNDSGPKAAQMRAAVVC